MEIFGTRFAPGRFPLVFVRIDHFAILFIPEKNERNAMFVDDSAH